jgi:hypothetical protein
LETWYNLPLCSGFSYFWIEYAEEFIEMQEAEVSSCILITCVLCFPLSRLFPCYELCNSDTRTHDLTSADMRHVTGEQRKSLFTEGNVACCTVGGY